MTDIAIVMAFLVLIGFVVGLVMFVRQRSGGDPSPLPQTAEIRMDRITIQGGIGAGVLILMLLASALIGIPVLRWLAFPGVFVGLVVGGSLAIWRHRHQ